jgi:hypothetical protein
VVKCNPLYLSIKSHWSRTVFVLRRWKREPTLEIRTPKLDKYPGWNKTSWSALVILSLHLNRSLPIEARSQTPCTTQFTAYKQQTHTNSGINSCPVDIIYGQTWYIPRPDAVRQMATSYPETIRYKPSDHSW